MNKPLKIAIYSGAIPSTTFIERLIRGLSSKEHKILLFGISTKVNHYSKAVSVIGYKSYRLNKAFHLFKYWLLLTLFNNKEKRILDNSLQSQNRRSWNDKLKTYPVLYYKPDVFHIQWAKGLEDWIWVQEFGIKLVLSLRGAHINYSPIVDLALAEMYKQNFPKVNGFHAVSTAIAAEASKYGANIETVRVVKSGLNLEMFPFKLKIFDSTTTLNILSVGRNHWIKNYRLALDVMYVLKGQGVPFQYNVVGVSESEALLFQREQLGLENDVSFINTMPFNEVQDAIRQADVLLLPSLKEGIANVVLEAMAIGTLVISTDCGGMAEVIVPNQTGFLVPIRNAQAIATALVEVSKLSTAAYQQITKEARRFIETHHMEEQMVNGMQELYESLN